MDFLDHFDKLDRPFIIRIFQDAFDSSFFRPQTRKRAENLTEMMENLERDLEARSKIGADNGMREHILDSELLEDRKKFARYIVREMQAQLEKRGKMHVPTSEGRMTGKAPSEKQVAFLKRLGFTGTVKTMAEAGRKIDELMNAKA